MPDLRGKVALITGASAGIGESTAKHFASLGCWLSLNARNTANLERVAEACCALGLPRDKVNNAAIPARGSIESASVEDFNRSWQTNFLGPLCMIKNAVPYLRQAKGSIVNISSISSLVPVPLNVPYSVAKVALDHLTRCAALENAPYGVRVNSIPSWTNSSVLCLHWDEWAHRTKLPTASPS
ncbi:uncharacterized oxidoreductase TM_0325-like isoform X2 [Dermacentor albipictus]|uniref:uncharacterized oxidoreductase TM_0325-like isoform X2 n=1 Tax=Dermacentor albipictus TaxID=60249 RepID=UPI0031FE0EAE